MDYIKKIYSICCHANADPEDYGSDIIPMVCHNRQIDMKKNLDKEDLEQYVTKIHEFTQDFFKRVNANKSGKDQTQKNASTETKKRWHSTSRDDDDE